MVVNNVAGQLRLAFPSEIDVGTAGGTLSISGSRNDGTRLLAQPVDARQRPEVHDFVPRGAAHRLCAYEGV
jgi:hypothetical protein